MEDIYIYIPPLDSTLKFVLGVGSPHNRVTQLTLPTKECIPMKLELSLPTLMLKAIQPLSPTSSMDSSLRCGNKLYNDGELLRELTSYLQQNMRKSGGHKVGASNNSTRIAFTM